MSKEKLIWGVITASAVGAVIGWLFATEDGKEVRGKIIASADSLSHEALETYERNKDKISQAASKLKTNAAEEIARVEKEMRNLKDQLA